MPTRSPSTGGSEEYRCAPLVELRRLEWARTIARHWLYETADAIRLDALKASDDPEVAGLAAKMDREEVYHRMHADMWLERLLASDEGRERLEEGVRELWPYALGVLDDELRSRFAAAVRGAAAVRAAGRRAGAAVAARGGARGAARRDDDGAPLGAGGSAVVTAEAVWEALAEIPDPEIPVISRRRPGRREGRRGRGRARARRVHADVHGLPCARDDARCRWRRRSATSAREPQVDVLLDDSWSTDRITPEGREKLREAGFAPPAPRAAQAPTLVQLQAKAFRCPYCGSTETRLDNIFGPTPCRSVRYCESCRQPFEQFKTI